MSIYSSNIYRYSILMIKLDININKYFPEWIWAFIYGTINNFKKIVIVSIISISNNSVSK